MILPIKFPSDETVILDEVSRFRALSPSERIKAIRDLVSAGAFLIERSPKADFLRAYAEEQEQLGKKAVKDFVARHAN